MRTLLGSLGAGALGLAFLLAGGVGMESRAQPTDPHRTEREVSVPAPGSGPDMCMAPLPAASARPGSVSVPIRKIGDLDRLRETVRTLNTQGYNYRELDGHGPPPADAAP